MGTSIDQYQYLLEIMRNGDRNSPISPNIRRSTVKYAFFARPVTTLMKFAKQQSVISTD
ncbi:MAG TPA: hypothetical protein VH186_37770 [Chloroflexia bacterium]|nr:hypothetical protein [Chloroflexia bacterium]